MVPFHGAAHALPVGYSPPAMSELRVRLVTVRRALGEGVAMAEVLGLPELSRLAKDPKAAAEAARAAARARLEALPLVLLHRHLVAGEPEVFPIEVEVEPRRRDPCWREPVRLELAGVRWAHGEAARVALVPALGIEVVATGERALEDMVRDHVGLALARLGMARSLPALAHLARGPALELQARTQAVRLATPLEQHRQADQPARETMLERLTDALDPPATPPAAQEVEDRVRALAELLGEPFPASVLLVGPSGAGKSALVAEVARRRRDLGLGALRFRATTGARLISGATGFGMWQDRCQHLCKEAATEPTLLHLGGLVELCQVGRHEGGALGVAGFLRPYLERRELQVVLECTPEEYIAVERLEPHLIRVLERLDVEEPGPPAVLRILEAAAPLLGRTLEVPRECLEVTARLHRRYATYSAAPGRPLRFLRGLARDQEPGTRLAVAAVVRRFSQQTGLPLFMLDEAVRLDVAATRAWFRQRLLGQDAAVDLVVDLLTGMKAGLARPGRPLASLLFVGPTGVGKTELAKTLAEFLFGSRRRLTRFDMSEYADPYAVRRLVGDGLGDEGLLTAALRDQPFSVVLLDEAEKAHPLFFDLLLQALGEGRLTDGAGRLADFRNAVVILTSNLGAQSFGKATPGLTSRRQGEGRAAAHFTREVEAFFRPELVNRLDRIVAFEPLDAASIEAVTRRELERLGERHGLRYREVQLTWDEAAVGYLAEVGFDLRYGARPLKRALERELLGPLARRLNELPEDEPIDARVSASGGALDLVVAPRLADEALARQAARARGEAAEAARQVARFRRRVVAQVDAPVMRRLTNEEFRLRRREAKARRQHLKGRRGAPDLPEVRARLGLLRPLVEGTEALAAGAAALEDQALLALYGASVGVGEAPGEALASMELERARLAFEAVRLDTPLADRALMTLYFEAWEPARMLLGAYLRVAGARGLELRARAVLDPKRRRPMPDEASLEEVLEVLAPEVRDLEGMVERGAEPEGAWGLLLEWTGPGALLCFQGEGGPHGFQDNRGVQYCRLEVCSRAATELRLPEGFERRKHLSGLKAARVYRMGVRDILDPELPKARSWRPSSFEETLAEVLEELLAARVEAHLEPQRPEGDPA